MIYAYRKNLVGREELTLCVTQILIRIRDL
jgi:hypothetical protein